MLLGRLLRQRRDKRVRDMPAEDYVRSRGIADALRTRAFAASAEPLRILHLADGWLHRPLCLPITADRRTLLDLHRVYFAPGKYDPIYTEDFSRALSAADDAAAENVLVLSTGPRNYWHFMMDFLPRLWWLAAEPSFREHALLIDSAATPQEIDVVKDVAARAGLSAPRFVRISADVQPLRNALCPGRIPWDTAAAIWDETLYPVSERPNRGLERLFVLRNAPTRRLVNQDEIAAMLERLGFACIDPGAMSFEEQVATFAGARTIVGVHGAALTNLLFAPRGATVVELFTTVRQPFYPALAAGKGLHHVSVSGRPAGSPRSHHDDFSIDDSVVRDVLRSIGAT